jgi:amidase
MAPDPSPSTAELAYREPAELLAAMASGELTSVEITDNLLRRIDEIDRPDTPTALRSVLAVSERALDEARASDDRRRAGTARPLEGIPVLVKDNIEVVGLPSCAGATSLLGRPPATDAPLVQRIRDAGAVILGTTNLSQWANIRSPRSSGGWSTVGGLTGNPWALDRNAGGSSSGTGAALAAGLAPLGIGTETDGSITCPCTLNGVAGIKPSVGAVPTQQVVPISHSQDSPGPMARSIDAVALLLEVLTGNRTIQERARRSPEDLTIAVAATWRTLNPGTDELFDSTVEDLRNRGLNITEVHPVSPTFPDKDDELTVMLCELKDGLDAYLPTRGQGGPQSLAEVVEHEKQYAAVEFEWFGHEFFERALELGGCDNDTYRQARRRNLEWAVQVVLEPALRDAAVLIAPTMGPAWKSDLVLGGHPALGSPITMPPAIAGWPIATVPMGLVNGMPVGMGIVGRPGAEGAMLSLARAIEKPERIRPGFPLPQRG